MEKLIPKTILNALSGKKVPVYGSGMNVRDWIYVEDHCSGIDVVIKKGRIGQAYLLGARNERTNLEIVKLILHMLKVDYNMIEFVEDRKGHDYRYAIDPSKVENELQWKPKYDFERALSITVGYYKNKLSRSH